jgi:signal peptidase II
MKLKHLLLIAFLVILADQAIKIYVKLHYTLDWPNNTTNLIGNWSQISFAENPGMAWSLKIAGPTGKLALSIFRLFAVIFGVFYIKRLIKQRYTKGFLICAALIWAGALGNLIDSTFYGLIFDKGMLYNALTGDYDNYQGLAQFTKFGNGYEKIFMGNVVDMFYFPLFDIPLSGGKKITFFNAVFNIADASISIGVLTILFFQKRLYKKILLEIEPALETREIVSDQTQVS